jgi:t-SNARE complex subunit (syntaxin)
MKAKIEKPKENKSRAVANSVTKSISNGRQILGLVDNRAENVAQRKLLEIVKNSPKIKQLREIEKPIINSDLTKLTQQMQSIEIKDGVSQEKPIRHINGCGCASCLSSTIQSKSSNSVHKQSKKVTQLAKCKHGKEKHKCKACQQSVDARNVNKVRMYQTPAKDEKTQKEREDSVKGKKGAIAHGFGKEGSNQSGKMKTILNEVNKKKKKKE